MITIAEHCLADLIKVSALYEMEAGDDYDLCDVIFHVIEDRGLIMTFDADGAELDVVEYERDDEPIAGGPLANQTIEMPLGKSGKREP